MTETIRTVTHCPTCGVECRVGGHTTHYYIPLPNRSLLRFTKDWLEYMEAKGMDPEYRELVKEAILQGENP